MTATNLYATDGHCHNAEPGTYGHECGKPAEWIGLSKGGHSSGFCDDCKQHGYERRDMVKWTRIGVNPELPDYDRLIAHASDRVPPDVRVDMCRHPTVITPTFWLFRGERQIGSVARTDRMEWRATRMGTNGPTGQQHIISLDDALRYATQ